MKKLTLDQAKALGYKSPKILSTGECAGLRRLLYTTGLFVGLDEAGYRTRFCYPTQELAEVAISLWSGIGDPPGPWIKQKGGVERTNPNLMLGLLNQNE